MIKLAIFDLDGTLLDTIEDLGDSVNEVLRARGFSEHSYAEYCYHIGDGMEMLIRRSLPEGSDNATIEAVLADYREAYTRNWKNKSKPYPGIVDLLDGLKAKGIRMAVLSNKPHDFTKLCVEELLPPGYFEQVFGQREGVPRKPDPGAALAIAEAMGVEPAEAMFIGDTDVDVKTGVGAGMVGVGVLWGFREEPELRAAGAKHIVSEAGEILALLDDAT